MLLYVYAACARGRLDMFDSVILPPPRGQSWSSAARQQNALQMVTNLRSMRSVVGPACRGQATPSRKKCFHSVLSRLVVSETIKSVVAAAGSSGTGRTHEANLHANAPKTADRLGAAALHRLFGYLASSPAVSTNVGSPYLDASPSERLDFVKLSKVAQGIRAIFGCG